MTHDPGPDLVGSERDVLLYYLGKNRDAVVRALDRLTERELRSPGVMSGTNLLGLVLHLTRVEQHWFQRVYLGLAGDFDESMDVPAGLSREEVVAGYRAACARSDEIVRDCPDLSTMAGIVNPGDESKGSLRRIIVHMIEETARHAGHADILREQIDGTTAR